MKKFLVPLGTLMCAATVLAGDPLSIAKQRAKETSQAVQGQPQGKATTRPAPAVVAPPNPAMMAMQQNISSMAADLAALQTEPSKKQTLINHLNAAAQGASPAKTSTTKLVDDLASVLTGKNLASEQRTKLAQTLRAVSNASHLSPAQQRTLLDDTQKILLSAGISTEGAAKVIGDLTVIAAETK